MKALLAAIATALVIVLPGSPGSGPVGPPTPVGSGWKAGEVTVNDTWHAMPSFTRNYATCDAVAAVFVHGIYDYGIDANGDLWAAVGLTHAPNGVEINIDGLHQGCFH